MPHIYAADSAWWNHHGDTVRATCPNARYWSQHEQGAGKFDNPEGITIVESTPSRGLCSEKLVQGMNSGYQAINLAYHLGATRVLLLGYDMHGRGTHFFGKHPAPLRGDTNYATFAKRFETMNPEQYGLEVINCTPGSALTCFPRMTLDEALKL